MTIKELSQLYWLNQEIEKDKRRLEELESKATDTSVTITGLPHVDGTSDKTAIAAEIADVRNIIEAKIKLSVAEYNRLNRYINSIDDSFIRQIIALRFINGLTWQGVADHIGGNTEDSVKKACYRYLKKCPTCPDAM